MRCRTSLLLLTVLLGCQQPPPAQDGPQEAARAVGVDVSVPGLYYFAGVVDGDSSTLWWTDPTSDDPAAIRREVATIDHAPGYPPRGAVSPDGSHVAWLRRSERGRHHDPAELVVDGVLVDPEALYLQSPRFVGDTAMYLRRWPGEPRFDGRGRQLQALDGFDLVAAAPDGRIRVVARWDALQVQLEEVVDDELVVTVLRDDGPRTITLCTDGARRSDESAPPPPEPRVRGRVGGERWEVAVAPVHDSVLWRVHGRAGLDFVLERPDGERVGLVPPGDPAREVTLLGRVP